MSFRKISRFMFADDTFIFKIGFIATENYVWIITICVCLHVYTIHKNTTLMLIQ